MSVNVTPHCRRGADHRAEGSARGAAVAETEELGAATMKSTGTEAPRPACDRTDGRSPGSRVQARHRLPGSSQWHCGKGSPLTVAGAAADLEPLVPHRIPCSLSDERPSMA